VTDQDHGHLGGDLLQVSGRLRRGYHFDLDRNPELPSGQMPSRWDRESPMPGAPVDWCCPARGAVSPCGCCCDRWPRPQFRFRPGLVGRPRTRPEVEVDCGLAGEDGGLDAVHPRRPFADEDGAYVAVVQDAAATAAVHAEPEGAAVLPFAALCPRLGRASGAVLLRMPAQLHADHRRREPMPGNHRLPPPRPAVLKRRHNPI
jgi:hypothetical protein